MDNNNNSEVVSLYLDDIIPNRFQPREVFDDQALKELAVSIKEHGVIQPIIVRKVENKYEIIAGERRYKASTMAGLTKIPAIIKNLDDKESSKIALIENLQRRDLTPIEEARTYQKILELEDNMTQEQLAATMGKTQSSVSNKLRLLSLPEEIQDALLKEKISERHARSLLNIEDKNDQIKMMDKVIAEKMTVRELDKEIREMNNAGNPAEGGNEVNVEIGNSIPAVASIAPAPEGTPTVDSNLTANDIAGEITTAPFDSSMLMGSNNNDSNPTPTINLMNLSSPEETTEAPADNNDTMGMNPTIVDINRIRENSFDIGAAKTTEPETEPQTEPATDEPKDDGFKFNPAFDFNNTNNNAAEQQETPTEAPANRFSGFFNTNVNNESTPQQDNANVASAISSMGLTVSNTKDVKPAVDDIKGVITSLQGKGYSVSFEENDGMSDYKITINIQK